MLASSTKKADSVLHEIVYVCGFEPDHEHILPGDWEFGGASDLDPRADPRWRPSTYVYFDDKLVPIHQTSAPFCDDEAIDYFTQVANFGPDFNPVWIRVRRPDGTSATLPVYYDKTTDSVFNKE